MVMLYHICPGADTVGWPNLSFRLGSVSSVQATSCIDGRHRYISAFDQLNCLSVAVSFDDLSPYTMKRIKRQLRIHIGGVTGMTHIQISEIDVSKILFLC